jgi:hypothetical protein
MNLNSAVSMQGSYCQCLSSEGSSRAPGMTHKYTPYATSETVSTLGITS